VTFAMPDLPDPISSISKLDQPGCPIHVYSGTFPFPAPPRGDFQPAAGHGSVSGKGWSDGEAYASCTGEAIERYSAMFRGDEALISARYADMASAVVHPPVLLQYSSRQYARRAAWNAVFGQCQYIPEPWLEDAPLEWTPCRSLARGETVYVPAGACYLRYIPPEARVVFPNETTGCASAATREDATLRAFLEVVERDAVSLWWYNRCRRPAISLDSFGDPLLGAAAAYLATHQRSLYALDITTEFGIPVFAAVSHTRGGDAILFGFAADFDVRSALRRAVAELLQVLGPPELWSREAMLEHYQLATDRRIWIHAATTANQPFLLPDELLRTMEDYRPAPCETAAQLLDRSLALAGSAGFDIVVCDVTRPETGTPAVKVLVPGLRSAWAHLGPGRLFEAPVTLGWLAEPLAEEDLNPFPFFL
jgi:oxazoline/thiazoline synthase